MRQLLPGAIGQDDNCLALLDILVLQLVKSLVSVSANNHTTSGDSVLLSIELEKPVFSHSSLLSLFTPFPSSHCHFLPPTF